MAHIDPKLKNLVDCWTGNRVGDRDELDRIDAILSQIANPDDVKSIICQGVKSRLGSYMGRMDSLAELAAKVIEGLLLETNEYPDDDEIIQNLWRFDDEDQLSAVIVEISGEEQIIHWLDQRGRERTTTFKAFKKRLYRIGRNELASDLEW